MFHAGKILNMSETTAVDVSKIHPEGDCDIPTEFSSQKNISLTAELSKALATPSRLKILLTLSHGPASVSKIVIATELSQPLVSQHLKVLRGIHLVSVQRDGREAIYSLMDDHVAHIILDAMAHVNELENAN